MATFGQLIEFGPYYRSGTLVSTLHVYHYITGTTTLKDVYTDRAKTTTAAQPVSSDSNGIVSFYADGLYKFVIKDGSDSTTLYTYDNWNVADASGASSGEGAALASAATLTLGTDGNQFHVTGSTGPITDLSGTQPEVTLIFDSTPTLTHSGNLILENTTDFTAAAGDALTFMNEGSDVWREISRRYALRSSYLYSRDAQGLLENMTLAVSVSAKALTVALKTKAAADPATTDPVRIAFRSATATTGTYVMRSVTAATSVTAPSTATLGFSAALASRIYVVALDNAGTVELALYHPFSTTTGLAGLNESVVYSSTAMTTSSDSSHVLYSTSARSNVAIRVLGYFDITTGATAGEWDNEDSNLQVMGPGTPRTGDTIQVVTTITGAVATGTTLFAFDDNAPANTHGDQFMTLAITPTSARNRLQIQAQAILASSVNGVEHAVLYQDSGAGLAVAMNQAGANDISNTCFLFYDVVAGTTSATTFKIRAGAKDAGTTTFNGASGARKYGGTLNSFMTIREICT